MSSLDLTPDRGGGGGGRDLAWERGFSVKGGGGGQKPSRENLESRARQHLGTERQTIRREQGVEEQAQKVEQQARELLQGKTIDLSPGARKELTDDLKQQWKNMPDSQKTAALEAFQKGETSPQARLAGAVLEFESARQHAADANREKAVLAKAGELLRNDLERGLAPAEPKAYRDRADQEMKDAGREMHKQQQEMYTARDAHIDGRENAAKENAGNQFDQWRSYQAEQQLAQKHGLEFDKPAPAGLQPDGPKPTQSELNAAAERMGLEPSQATKDRPQDVVAIKDAREDYAKAAGAEARAEAKSEWQQWRAYDAQVAYAATRTDGIKPTLEQPQGQRPEGPPPTQQELDKAKRELQPKHEQIAERTQWHEDLDRFCSCKEYKDAHVKLYAVELDARDRQTAALALHAANRDELKAFQAGAGARVQEERVTAQDLARAEARAQMDPAKREVAERTERLVERFPERQQLTTEQARAVVKDALELEKGRAQKGMRASAATLKQYESNAKSLDNKGNTPETAANTRASFYSYRAAVVKEATQAGRDANRDLAKAWGEQKELKKEAAEAGWRGAKGVDDYRSTNPEFNERWQAMEGRKADAEQRIQAAAQVLTRYEPGELSQRENLDREGVRMWQENPDLARSTGKREAEAQLPRGWQDKIFDEASRADRPAVAVLSVAGVRPTELEKGVKLQRTADGGLDITIKGAKVDEYRGTKERVVHVTPEQIKNDRQAEYLHKLAGDKGGTRVTVKDSGGLSERIAEIGDRNNLDVSGYSFRHGFATDARDAGMSNKEIGPLMGHRAERSTRGYGS